MIQSAMMTGVPNFAGACRGSATNGRHASDLMHANVKAVVPGILTSLSRPLFEQYLGQPRISIPGAPFFACPIMLAKG